MREGRAEFGNGIIDTPGTRALLTGSIDLGARNTALRLTVQPHSPTTAPPVILELKGPLRRLSFGSVVSGQAGQP